MTEIEKMYENAGVEPIDSKLEPMRTLKFSVDDIGNTWTREQYMKEVPIYPPFAADKQLGLIKWLAIRFNSDYMSYWHNEIKDVWIFRLHDLTELSSEEPCIQEGRNKNFADALCNLINHLWQDLTDEEKEEIRRILNE